MVKNAEKKGFIKWLVSALCISAFADEGDPPPADPAPPVNFEKLIAQARQEEKAKLYPQIEKLKGEKDSLTASINNLLLENGALKDEIAKYKSTKQEKPEDSEAYKSLKAQFDELTAEMETLKKAPKEEEIRKQLEAEYEIKNYLREQLEKNKGEILTMLVEGISGKTKEEIDAAIAAAKEKTLSVKKDLGLIDDEGNPITPTHDKSTNKSNNSTKKTTTPTRAPNVAPADDTNGGQAFTVEYIQGLDPRSPEYAEFRKKMGLK